MSFVDLVPCHIRCFEPMLELRTQPHGLNTTGWQLLNLMLHLHCSTLQQLVKTGPHIEGGCKILIGSAAQSATMGAGKLSLVSSTCKNLPQ